MRIGHGFAAYRHQVDTRAADCREDDALWAAGNGHSWRRLEQSTSNIAWSRNLMCSDALAAGLDILILQDADAWVPGGALAPLLRAMAQTDAAVVVPVFAERGSGIEMVWPRRPAEVYDASVVSGSLMLLDLRQLHALPMPWFAWEFDGARLTCREDVHFARKVRAAGLRVMADWTIPACHRDELVRETAP